MKKLSLSILLTLLPILASAETVEIDGIWYNLITKTQEAEVIKNPNIDYYTGSYSGNIEIPKSVTYNDINYSVTSIGDKAFELCFYLTSITIPNSVTSIGNHAFYYCSSLTSITIPNSVTSIGYYAFNLCLSLVSITIPNGVTFLGDNVFMSCSNLTNVNIPISLPYIGSCTFYECSKLTSISIPNSVTSIAASAFSGCSGLTSITIPNSVTSIGSSAFSGCSGLSSVTIPNSVSYLPYQSFYGCTSLTSVTIRSDMKNIGNQAFANCYELTDVYCMAEKLSKEEWGGEGLYTYPDAFMDSYPQYITLHVPAASIEAYRSTEPWSQFKAIVALEDGDNPEIQKCATPEISYADGKLDFSCETEGVEFVSEVIVDDAKKYYDASVTLSQTYKITVYATKAGFENSDIATREIVIENGQTSLFGDLNKDGKVNVADHVKLSSIILNQ